jgi:RES domain-containing protein
MVFWRISRHRDLSGIGGLKAGGRWHFPGQLVVYLSENPASALLEVSVHTAANDVPPDYTLLRVKGPDIATATVTADDLPEDWQAHPDATREFGTAWLRRNERVHLKIPSAIVLQTWNFLFNQLHANASAFRIVGVLTYPFHNRIT